MLLLFIQNSCSDIAGSDNLELGPGIKSVIPARGPLGAQITINGEGFGINASDVQLYFNSSKASIESLRDTTIFTRVPKDAKSGTIQVIVNGDTLAGPAFTVDTTKTLFLNIENVTPLAGVPGDIVNIAGTGFKPESVQNKVFFNDVVADIQNASDTLLKAIVPSDAQTGNLFVVVEQDTAKGPVFRVEAKDPFISSIDPRSGVAGAKVIITGENFSSKASENKVTFNGKAAEVSSATKTKLITAVPEEATNGPVKVTVGEKTATGPIFTVEAMAPVINSIDPKSGVRGTKVTIIGKNFSSEASENKVTFNGKAAEVSSATETKLITAVPEGATTGPVKVSVENKSGTGPIFTVVTEGTLKINITTTGENKDKNGYVLAIDDAEGTRTKITDSITRTVLQEGSHNIELSDIASNCKLINDVSNPRTIQVVADETTTTEYSISCEKGNMPPAASFTYTCQNLSCKFDGSSSSDVDGSIAEYSWDYGEYGSDRGATVEHHFEVSGTYTVTLEIKDNEDATGSISKDVTVTLPEVENISPSSGPRGTEVVISGSGFSVNKSDNKISFTSGSGEVNAPIKSASATQLVVDVPGDATTGPVSVKVFDYVLKGPTFNVEINQGPEASFVYECENLDCKFDASGSNDSDGSITGYSWRFGDAINGTGKTTSHDYEGAGSYTVQLTVTDNKGATGSVSKNITASIPSIKNISPSSGLVGTEVTISGSGFSSTKSDNEVTFTSGSSEVGATIKSASETELVVDVPGDATTGPVYVSTYGYKAEGPEFDVITAGSINVNIATTGPSQDQNGYELILDNGDPSSVDINDVVTFSDVEEGSHAIELADIASNCLISQDRANPYNINVTAGKTTTTNIDVRCESTAPTISSISPESGPTGTEVSIKGKNFSSTASENVVTFNGVRAELNAASTDELLAIVPGRTTTGPVNVTVGKQTAKGPVFKVIAVHQPKTLHVITETANPPLGFNGYTLSVTGKDTRFINPNGEQAINNIFDSPVDVELSGIPEKCSLTGNNPRSVVFETSTATTTFSITCTLPAPSVDSISPESGPVGTEVTISGSRFSSVPSENIVEFTSGNAKVQATVKTVTEAGQLIVDVPDDATTGPVSVTTNGQTTTGPAFTVVTTGRLDVNISTTGVSQDPNGYNLILDEGDASSVGKNETATFNGLEEGTHSVELADIAANCFITQDRANPYDVQITVGNTTSTDIDILCENTNEPPVAFFVSTCRNLSCDFSASDSYDPDGPISSYAWDYGEYGTGTGSTVTHHYEVPGTYTVTLTVTDNEGASSSSSKDIKVTLPQISGINPTSGPIATEVTISGSGFSADKSDDEVNFTSGNSEVNATIKSASKTKLVVDVPSDATTGPVYVSTYGYKISGPTFTVEQPGALEINTIIEGTQLDTDGYTVTVSGSGSKPITNEGSVTFSGIYDSLVQVELTDVAANCRVDGDNPRTVSIAEGDLVSTSFNVDCTQDLRGKIIFVTDRTGNSDIFMQDADGNSVQQITNTNVYEYVPKISPGGLKIAYIAYASGRQVFIMDSDGSDLQQITNSGYYRSVDWSPDGTKLVVSRSDNSDAVSDIYTMDIDGGNQQNITNTSTDREGDPDWSADGSRIIYISGNSNIISIKPNGSNKVQLTSGNTDSRPEWSPDGTKIAFVRYLSGTGKIHIMNADGTGASELTPSSYNERSPTWSPDGNRIAFASYNDGYYSIFIFSIADDDLISRPYTSSDDSTPHWNYQ